MSENLGTIYYVVEADTEKLLSSVNPVDKSLDGLNKTFGKTDKAAKNTEFQMKKTSRAVQDLGSSSSSLSVLDKTFIGLAASAGALAIGLAKIALSIIYVFIGYFYRNGNIWICCSFRFIHKKC